MLLIDKPVGITSFDVIRHLKKSRPREKFGHAGTLDPRASGLLLILENTETKHAQEYIGLSKTYEVEALIGERRDTGDMEGVILEESPVTTLSEPLVREVLSSLTGALKLPVPAYSAVKRGGVPLYKKARRGEDVTSPIKTMEIRSVTYTAMRHENDRVIISFTADVGSGTYIRSLVEELGRHLSLPATTYSLRRTRIGDFSIDNAQKLTKM